MGQGREQFLDVLSVKKLPKLLIVPLLGKNLVLDDPLG